MSGRVAGSNAVTQQPDASILRRSERWADGYVMSAPVAITAAVAETGHSRYPVVEPDRGLDDLLGVIYVKDLLHHWRTETAVGLSLRALMRKPYFVPEQKPISASAPTTRRSDT